MNDDLLEQYKASAENEDSAPQAPQADEPDEEPEDQAGQAAPSAPEPVRPAPRRIAAPRFETEAGEQMTGTQLSNGQIEYHTPETQQQAYNRLQEQMIQNLPPSLQGQFRLQQLQLSQREQIQLQRMRNGQAAIDANPFLTDEQKAHAKMMYATKINPYALRQAEAQALGTQLKNQQMQAELKHATDMETMAAEMEAQSIDKRIGVTTASKPGEAHYYYNRKTGKIERPDGKDEAQDMKLAQELKIHNDKMALEREKISGKQALKQDESDAMRKDEEDFRNEYDKARARVEKRIQLGTARGGIDANFYEKHLPEGVTSRSALEDYTNAEMANGPYKTSDLQEHLKRRAAARHAARSPQERATLGDTSEASALPSGEQKTSVGPSGRPGQAGDDAAIAAQRQGQQDVRKTNTTLAVRDQARDQLQDRMAGIDNAYKWASAHGDKSAVDTIQRLENIMRVYPDPSKIPPDLAEEVRIGYQKIAKYHQMK